MPLIRLFFDICRLRKGPQDCPASRFLFGLAVGANLLVSFLLSLSRDDWTAALGQSLVGIGLLAGFLWGALYLTDKLPRWIQTGTAAFGTDTVISLLACLLILVGQAGPDLGDTFGWLLLLLMAWQIVILGHILRHALSVPLVGAMGLALAYFASSLKILMALFPGMD